MNPDVKKIRVLIADDDTNLRTVLGSELSYAGYSVVEADGGKKALDRLAVDDFDVLLLDLNMPDISGMAVLKTLKERDNPVEVIVFTAYASVSTAVEAMKLGAFDYLTKPFKIEELKALMQKAYDIKNLVRENQILRAQIEIQSKPVSIVTKNRTMLELFEDIRKYAASDFPVLICGETGVGKELVARALHEMSHRSKGPFVPINCAAIPEPMLESELFGFEKGAFTGAVSKKLGLIEVANEGVLFFDEIGEMPPGLQAKLLRVIESGTFYRIGATRETKVDVKIVSATNRDLSQEMHQGRFRSDLYYRVSTLALRVIPLRERSEDILLLVHHFMKNSPAYRHKKFTDRALKVLEEYPWPGNVRELQNVVQRALLKSTGELIDVADLPCDLASVRVSDAASELGSTFLTRLGSSIADVEKEHVLKVLAECRGDRARAAAVLGISTKTLGRKLGSYRSTGSDRGDTQ